ncbi:MAG TPA: hypothetical protein DCE76_10115 [Anaerolineaceae bacterium]|nr:hypothetical protein [Anaerolineaceae bacterium]
MQKAQAKRKNLHQMLASILIFITILVLLAIGIRLASGDVILGTDYYIFYTAARMYLHDGISPYADEVTHMAQLDIYGRLANPNEDQLAFVYPFFMLFLVIPFSWLDIYTSQSVWMSINLIISVYVLTTILNKRKILLPLALAFYPYFLGLFLGNFSNFVGFILLFIIYQLLYCRPSQPTQILIGFLLAWLLGKPQLTLILLIFIIVFSYTKNQKTLIISFTLSTVILISSSILLFPNWPVIWLQQVRRYAEFTHSKPAFILSTIFQNSPLENFILPTIIGFTLLIILFWYRLNRHENNRWNLRENLSVVNLLLSTTIFLMPRTLSYDQILVFIGLVLGTKYLNNYKITIPLWLFYTSLSWITFASGDIFGFSSTNVIFPLVASTTWPLIFWLLTRKSTREFEYAPS